MVGITYRQSKNFKTNLKQIFDNNFKILTFSAVINFKTLYLFKKQIGVKLHI